MATYKGIKGFNIQTVSSDPPAPFIGEVWYNSASATVKYFGVQIAAWSTGGNKADGSYSLAGAGTQTAGLAFGGESPPGDEKKTEEYNGTSWTNGGAMTTGGQRLAGAGTQTAGLGFGGKISTGSSNATEEYNGSSSTPPYTRYDATEEYNGTAWTGGGTMNFARQDVGGAGTQTSALVFGGSAAPPVNVAAGVATEEYDGSSWTVGGSLSIGRKYLSGCGESNSGALAISGNNPGILNTEQYNGTAWTSTASLNTGLKQGAGAGTTTAALAFGGTNPPDAGLLTQEFNDATPATFTVGTD